jgi:acetylornithine deacetylase
MEPHVELLSQLISIPSVNPMGRDVSGPEYLETALTAFLENWLRRLDVDVKRQSVSPGRDNLLATFHSPGSRHHVLLEVHQDTVPADGMTVEPFRATLEGNQLYGRGACDNKGPMTSMLLALRRLALERPRTAATVTLALTVDEEFTFTGAQQLVNDAFAADCAVVAEPTEMEIVIAHKGAVRWEVVTRGRACHSSDPRQGANAIYRMADVVGVLEQFAGELNQRPADPLVGGPTLSVGRIHGGTAVNIVPDSCSIEIDRRLIPGETPAGVHREVIERLRLELGDDFPVECREPWLRSAPLGTERNGPLADRFGRSIDAIRGAHKRRAVPFGTDAAVYNLAGIPSIVFGPGSVAKAHTADEWVPLDEVAQAIDIYYDFCVRWPEFDKNEGR